ncbi:MAG: NAD(P)-dependent alcohol dehydrogenase [Candidatus Nanopelagicales bacterium]
MKALTQDRYGPPDVLVLSDVPTPTPGEGEVLVRVRAAGVDAGVWHVVAGMPYAVRAGFGLTRPRRATPGIDLAGVVEAVGPGVTRLAVGDEVLGIGQSTFAELAVALERKLVRKPASLTFEQAAALPVSGITALEAVRKAGVQEGQKVLVTGAGGGVGSYAVQIAAAAGAHVTGLVAPERVEAVLALGAAEALDRTREDVDARGPVYDAIIDTAGRRPLRQLRRAMTPRGTLAIVGGEGGGKALGGFGRLLVAPLASAFVGQRFTAVTAHERLSDLEELVALVESGAATPYVGRTYPLAAGADALRDLHEGRATGKLVITV